MSGLRVIDGERVDVREPEQIRPPEFTDDALALQFAEENQDRLRYVAEWSRWLKWDGTRWAFENTLHALDLARDICRRAAVSCNEKRSRSALASAQTVAAVERLAK